MQNRLFVFLIVFSFLTTTLAADGLKLIPPLHGAYQGAFMDFGPTASAVTAEKIQLYEQTINKKSIWAYFANDWLDGKIIFPRESAEIIRNEKLIPYIRLMPWSNMSASVTKADPIFYMQSFLDGKHDAQLKTYFTAAKDFNGPLMMEFCPEVNGDWFPWNGTWNGGKKTDGYGDPAEPDGPERFKDVLKHVINISRAAGATNITWVFHVDSAKSPEAEWNDIKHYYPGDDYIDWIGISVFGAQLPTHEWSLFQSKLKRFVPDIEKLNSKRPWLIAEMGVIESAQDSSKKSLWLKQALGFIEAGIFPDVKGITYWNSPGWLANGKASFKIDSSQMALETFKSQIGKDFWLSEPQFSAARF